MGYRGLGITIIILAASATHQGHPALLSSAQHQGSSSQTQEQTLQCYTQRHCLYTCIGPQRNLARGTCDLVYWNCCKVTATYSINGPWKQEWPRYNWYSAGNSDTKMAAELVLKMTPALHKPSQIHLKTIKCQWGSQRPSHTPLALRVIYPALWCPLYPVLPPIVLLSPSLSH